MCILAVIGENVFCGLQVKLDFRYFLASFTIDYVLKFYLIVELVYI